MVGIIVIVLDGVPSSFCVITTLNVDCLGVFCLIGALISYLHMECTLLNASTMMIRHCGFKKTAIG